MAWVGFILLKRVFSKAGRTKGVQVDKEDKILYLRSPNSQSYIQKAVVDNERLATKGGGEFRQAINEPEVRLVAEDVIGYEWLTR